MTTIMNRATIALLFGAASIAGYSYWNYYYNTYVNEGYGGRLTLSNGTSLSSIKIDNKEGFFHFIDDMEEGSSFSDGNMIFQIVNGWLIIHNSAGYTSEYYIDSSLKRELIKYCRQ